MADISKAEALALLAEQDIDEIINPKTSQSAALQSFHSVKMTAGTAKMPVLAALPTAGWVTDTGASTDTKPTSKMSWKDKNLVAEEIAVIVPIHENTLADSKFDIWGQVRPLVVAEFGRVLDLAIFQGVNKPASWTDAALIPGAISAGNMLEATADVAEDFNDAFALVENDEFDVNAVYTGRFMRSQLRGLRDSQNRPVYLDALRSDGDTSSIYGQDLFYVTNRSWNRNQAIALVGDRDAVTLGIREDVQVKLLDQATVGGINLAERDMVAMRFKFRVAYATAYSTAGMAENAYPFSVITPDVTP